MKKVLPVIVVLTVITYFSCSKNGKEPLSQDPLVTKMVKDADVQAYFSLIADQIKQISVPYTKELLNPNRVKPTIPSFETEAKKVVSTHVDETNCILETGMKISQRYNLGKLKDTEVRELFDHVMDEFAKNPKKHSVSRRDPTDAASIEQKDNEGLTYYARYQSPETTTCVKYYLITYYEDDPSTILTAAPLFQSCTESENPYQTGSANHPFDSPDFSSAPADPNDSTGLVKKLKYCHDDWLLKLQRCDRNAEVNGGFITLGFVIGAGAALIITDGVALKFTPQALSAYAAAMASVAATCYLCKQDAGQDRSICVSRAYN